MQRTYRDSLLLALVCLILLIPLVAWRELGGIEFRTALFARYILRNGPTLIPRLYDSPYYDYPPLYFLLAAACSKAFGSLTPLPLALPGILAAAGTVFLSCLFAGRIGRRLGWMSGLALLATPIFLSCSPIAAVDTLLTFFIALCLISYHLYLSRRKAYLLIISYAGLAGAALTKGPIGVVLPCAVIFFYLLFLRQPREIALTALRLGFFLLALAAALSSATALSEGRHALRELIDAQLLDRVVEEPNVSRAYYFGVFLGALAPWSLIAFLQLFRRADADDRERILLFSKVWLVTTFILFSLARIKHTRYLIPLAPPTAILCAAFWERYLLPSPLRCLRKLLSLIRVICIAALAAGAAAAAVGPLWFTYASRPLLLLLPLLGTAAAFIFAWGPWRPARDPFIALSVAICYGFLLFFQFGQPHEEAKRQSRPFVIAAEDEAQGVPVVFFAVNREKEGLRYAYWSLREDDLRFAGTLEELEDVLSFEAPALVVAPQPWRDLLGHALGARLRFLGEGRIGKRTFALFCWNSGER